MLKTSFLRITIITLTFKLLRCQDVSLKFPEGFFLGTATSAYQVEGAWNVSDKAVSTWDYFVHNSPQSIQDHLTADVTTDSYHKYKEDVDIMKNLGVDHYRFSLSWSRILPKGHDKHISKSGLSYYHKILDSLEEAGIEPFVTIYHWDHPQIIEESGGWLNETTAYLYADYARIVFKEFAHRVKYFITINEPQIFCSTAYRGENFPPNLRLNGTGDYMCVHNMLKAHALAYHIYNDEFRSEYNGKIGITMQCKYPYSKYENDKAASNLAFEFECGWQANAIYSDTGDYPKIMKQRIAEKSRFEGRVTSRLPKFSDYWIKKIRGSADFFGLNHYTSIMVESLPTSSMRYWYNDEGLIYSHDPKWKIAQSEWLKIVPDGFGELLRTIKDKYNNPPVIITENGASDANGLNDTLRMNYLYSYLKEMLIAINRDGCNVKAHTVWSLLDSFEWNYGYTHQYGLVHVDFSNKNLTRTLKKSAYWLKTILKTRELHRPDLT